MAKKEMYNNVGSGGMTESETEARVRDKCLP